MASTPQPKHASSTTEPQLPEPKACLSPSSSIAGSKRPAPSLLPPFEPLSSSPGLPRPLKRQNTGTDSQAHGLGITGRNSIGGGSSTISNNHHARLKYPTPVPTSSTGILSSSPPQHRPALQRNVSERAPLSAVPSVELSENGETLMMGRSSNSSHYQLSANRLVSRVHVKARYIAAAVPLEPSKIEIICNGWNGLKLHCQGRTWELFKGDSFTSETEGTEIMVDVQDARVLIQWPKKGADGLGSSESLANLSDSSWDDSPRSQLRDNVALQSSPLRRATRVASPESPSPAQQLASSQRLQDLLPGVEDRDQSIHIYEDEPELPKPKQQAADDVNISMMTEATASFSSDLSELEDNDPDEENDPIVHSFGPFGANLQGRLASISTNSPRAPKPTPRHLHKVSSQDTLAPVNSLPQSASVSPKKEPREDATISVVNAAPIPKAEPSPVLVPIAASIINHVVNQLAFSRLSSTPLPTIVQNLPAEDRDGLCRNSLRAAMEATSCIGTIARQGKDAAGKPLESEYYYVPERDEDEQRRAAVVDGLRKPSLRACRKQHKQYYWKRPKTP